jgi:hypothetical protein
MAEAGRGEGELGSGYRLIRREVFLIVLKLLGLFLLVLAFLSLADLAAGIYALQEIEDVASSINRRTAELVGGNPGISGRFRTFLIIPLLKLFLYFGVGLYLLMGGGALLRRMMKIPDTD